MKPVFDATSVTPPAAAAPATERDVTLRMKDGVRELRSVARLGAQRLAHTLVERSQQAPPWAPPLAPMVQRALGAVDELDRLAVHLVSSAHEYRQMNFGPLCLQAADAQSLLQAGPRALERNFYWVFKHLLKREHCEGVTVREEQIHQAAINFLARVADADALPPVGAERAPAAALRAQQLAMLAHALSECQPLHRHALATSQEPLERLNTRMVMAAVLVGEVAYAYPHSTLPDTLKHALDMAAQMARSRAPDFARALSAARPLESLMGELAFVLRHI